MNFIIGPVLLVRFKLGKHLIYLFGDDHTNLENPKNIYTIDYQKIKLGVNASKVTIERFIYELYERAKKQNAHLNLLFEITPSKEIYTFKDPNNLNNRFDRLLLLLNVYKFNMENNITINPVDFRVMAEKDGSGSYQSVALNYFSLFVILFKNKEYDLIDKIFPINEFEWDIRLLKDTLMDGNFERKEIPAKYEPLFEDVKDLNGYVQSKYFNELPHEGLKELIRDLIERKANSISQDYLTFIKDTTNEKERKILEQKIAAVHMWFMDIPAFCVLMEKVTPRPGLTVGYYGAEHVTNILPLIARLDPYFTTHVAGCEGLDLPTEIREELMEFIN